MTDGYYLAVMAGYPPKFLQTLCQRNTDTYKGKMTLKGLHARGRSEKRILFTHPLPIEPVMDNYYPYCARECSSVLSRRRTA